ncbi:MAG: TonB-dependent receptor [Sphingomonadaceae bacterium]|nr:TonB-dependent receptor [Sphingomonadaceae bacterium]
MTYNARRNNYMKSVAFLALAIGLSYPAIAQTLPAPNADQTVSTEAQKQAAEDDGSAPAQSDIIVTGTSIRGAPAVGSNLISIGRDAIEDNAVQTVQQLLKTVPAIGGAQGAGQGSFAANDSAGAAVPQIHGLGGSNSSSTLVVVDGHRFPLTGLIRNLPDPNFIPTNAIERVEVLAEGASSIYGSDATAGVLNFITRRNINKLELNAQYGFADNYKQWSVGAAYGHRWDTGGFGLFYTYSERGDLLGADRPLTLADQRARGGTNFGNFACSPATFQPAGSTTIFTSPYGAANGIANAQANAPCEQSKYASIIPQERRHSVMFKVDQNIGDRLKLNADIVYSLRNNVQRNAVAVASSTGAGPSSQLITATVFGPGSGKGGQINPFFVTPTGTTATSGTIRFDANGLFPDGSRLLSRSETFYGYANAEYELTDNWRLTGFVVAGFNNSKATITGSLCQSCLLLALNGSTNANGNLTQPSIPNTNVLVTNVPLTTANAVDVWNPLATNRTSPAVLARLRDSLNFQASRQTIQQYNLKVDGTLLENWAGSVKLALGTDIVRYTQDAEVVEPNNTGPSSSGSSYNSYRYERNVAAIFGELLVPIVSPEMGVPFARRIDINVSGRLDHYNEFGNIKNPKVAANWEVVEGLKFRGNYSTSFVAPQFSTYGPDVLSGIGGRSIDTFFGPQNGTLNVPLDRYPEARAIPGCNTAGQAVCVLGTASIAGMRLDGANPDVKPSTGSTWALGADFNPTFAPGLTASLTYWHTTINGTSGGPPLGLVVNSTAFHDLLKIYPNGATAAEIEAYRGGRRQRSPLSSGPIYFGLDFRNFNVYYLFVEGIDFDVHYRHRFDWGGINGGISGTYKTKFDQNAGPGEPTFSVLNKNRFDGTFPTLRTDLRADLGLDVGAFSASTFVNYTGGFTFFGSTALNPVTTTNGAPTGGGDNVKSYMTVDLNLTYKFGDALPGQPSVFVNIQNLFDRYPPFENTASGYDNFVSFVLGRQITAGLRLKF